MSKTEEHKIHYCEIDKGVKKMCQSDKRAKINKLIEDAEQAANRGEQGTPCQTMKISGKYNRGCNMIRNKDGLLLSKEDDIKT